MKPYPETPHLEEAGSLTGHLWVQELPTGGRLRFQVAASGLVTFGIAGQSFDAVEAAPAPYRRAAAFVTEHFDRNAFHGAADDPEQVTFFGLATRNEGVTYDWSTLPAFVATDIGSGETGEPLAPDTASSVFRRLGLPALPAVTKEARAAHTDLGRYRQAGAFPTSRWRDGDAAAVLIRDKSGGRSQAWRPGAAAATVEPATGTAAELAAEYATDSRIERTVTELRGDVGSPTVGAVRDRLVADITREAYGSLYADGESVVPTREFEAALAERVQQQLSTGESGAT